MTLTSIDLIAVIEILGTFAFAVSGAVAAIQSRYDIFGILVLAFVTAIGGGTIRDLLIGNVPVSWLTNDLAIWSAFAGFLLAMALRSHIRKVQSWIFFFDAAGLGLFTVMGTQIGFEAEMGVGISVALGTITGCFGGVIRDILAGVKPLIFRKEIYAMASILGGLLYAGILSRTEGVFWAQILAIASIIIIRSVAVRYNLSLPQLKYKV